ncbi:MAG: thioredoxin domain-containing protein [Bacteroidetes bacterium]|nr:thioredoxin domain-containing protein [Bacteroidota bacterium]
MPKQPTHTNELVHESSPYLLQHAHNPVNWVPFSSEAFERAKTENKLVLISIGYSACHWCHVMEHESFEDENIAKLMNENFINIKVDREERSDVDMIYMQAVQLMTGQGGWPLNCFALPDGRPVYGGTYFNMQQWANVLLNLAELQKKEPLKVIEYAQNLTDGLKQSELITTQKKSELKISKDVLADAVEKWKERFDDSFGGPDKAPKFPLPNNYLFLLRYALLQKDNYVLDHVHLTLLQMAHGGIYDQLRGGFSRYSVDVIWKVPHFEKMLYDNAQLISLYCEAYQHSQNKLYKQVVTQTLDFIEKEWYNSEGYFYSAYDADIEGEEGKYYVWTKEDLHTILKDDFDLFADYYQVNEVGYWEHDNYILMRNENAAEISVKFNLSSEVIEQKIENCRTKLLKKAETRVKPGLDDKTITSWNAMMCTAYAKAYLIFGDEHYKKVAVSSAQFILTRLTQDNGKLFRTFKNGKAKIDGFLEDYAFTIEALLQVNLITQDKKYLEEAKKLTAFTLEEFKNEESAFLYYTGKSSDGLITRNTEIHDNVIPASNSQMALNLFYLGTLFDNENYSKKAFEMLNMVSQDLKHYASGYSNWGCLALYYLYPLKEIAIVGNNVDEKLKELHQHSFTNTILAVSKTKSDLPLLKDRFKENETLVYVCENKACKLPVKTIKEALDQLEKI